MTSKVRVLGARWPLFFLVLFSFAWRIHNLGSQSLWRDEVDAIYFALRDLPATLSMFVGTAQNGALYFLGLRPWLTLAGSSEFSLRYLSLLFAVLSIPLLWQVCKKLSPASTLRPQGYLRSADETGARRVLAPSSRWLVQDSAPLIAAGLLAINPYHLWYSQEGKMYTLTIFLALLAVWFWLRGIERGGFRPWLGFLLVVSLAIYSHLLMILLIPLFLAWFVIAWPKSKQHWKGFLLALAGLTLPYLPLLVWQWEFLTAKGIVTALDFVPLAEILKMILFYQSNSFIIPRHIAYLVPIFGLAIAGLIAGFRLAPGSQGRDTPTLGQRRQMMLVLAWLVVPVLGIYILSLRQPVFLPRYVIWITPAATIVLAFGFQSILANRERLSRALALSLMLYMVVYWSMIGWQEKTYEIKTDLRSAVSFLAENRSPEDLLIIQIPHLNVAYQYYSSDKGPDPFADSQARLGWWAAGLSPAMSPDDESGRKVVNEQMRRLTFGANDIWLMLSEARLADPSLLMLDWLDAEATLITQVDFHGVQVRHYRQGMPFDLALAN